MQGEVNNLPRDPQQVSRGPYFVSPRPLHTSMISPEKACSALILYSWGDSLSVTPSCMPSSGPGTGAVEFQFSERREAATNSQ